MGAAQQSNTSAFQELGVYFIMPVLVGILTLTSWMLEHFGIGPDIFHAALAIIATLAGGLLRFISGFRDIFNRRITVNVFVTTAIIASLAIGEFLSAAIIVFIMAVAGALESYTLDKNRKSIRSLLELAPQRATVRREGTERTLPISEIKIDDTIIVRPGDRIPVDGSVITGESCVNQAAITGESIPVEKYIGSEVFAGSLNESGRLEIRTSKIGKDTTLAKIVHLVESANETKAPIQNLADRFTKWFLPFVLILAIIGYFTSGEIEVSVSILLVACPCAFAIATPTAVTAGISNLARRSAVLIKGGIFLELAARMDTLLVDKTGTLTFGRPKVVNIITFDGKTENEVLRLAGIAEKYSGHPLAKSVVSCALERNILIPDPDEFKTQTGMGVSAKFNDSQIIVGKTDFLLDKQIPVTDTIKQTISDQIETGNTVLVVAENTAVIGLITVADEIRPETSKAVSLLKSMGIRVIMLTGDNSKVARSVAQGIGADDYKAELLPEDKQEIVKRYRDQGRIVGMAGDGINDAPALALADIGIGMGAGGTDVAIETANVTLMNDDMLRVADFVWMSKKVFRRIKLNIFFSMIYNAVGLVLASFGLLTPVLAVTFQEAGCITVILSSTLLLWAKTPWSRQNYQFTEC